MCSETPCAGVSVCSIRAKGLANRVSSPLAKVLAPGSAPVSVYPATLSFVFHWHPPAGSAPNSNSTPNANANGLHVVQCMQIVPKHHTLQIPVNHTRARQPRERHETRKTSSVRRAFRHPAAVACCLCPDVAAGEEFTNPCENATLSRDQCVWSQWPRRLSETGYTLWNASPYCCHFSK